jgi:hypothetical protein
MRVRTVASEHSTKKNQYGEAETRLKIRERGLGSWIGASMIGQVYICGMKFWEMPRRLELYTSRLVSQSLLIYGPTSAYAASCVAIPEVRRRTLHHSFFPYRLLGSHRGQHIFASYKYLRLKRRLRVSLRVSSWGSTPHTKQA